MPSEPVANNTGSAAIMQIAIICVVAIICIYICKIAHRGGGCWWCGSEDFATVEEKASQLTRWIDNHPTGPYIEFIQANPDSNIVEYNKLRELSATNQLTGPHRILTAARALRV